MCTHIFLCQWKCFPSNKYREIKFIFYDILNLKVRIYICHWYILIKTNL